MFFTSANVHTIILFLGIDSLGIEQVQRDKHIGMSIIALSITVETGKYLKN